MTDTQKTLIQSLIDVQKELKPVKKEVENGFTKSKYADLRSVVESCMPILTKHGFCITQIMSTNEQGQVVMTTELRHSSGDKLTSSMPLITAKNDMQSLGSAITYARRYQLMAIIGLTAEDEDDDGQATTTQIQAYPDGYFKAKSGKWYERRNGTFHRFLTDEEAKEQEAQL